jgi:hypothetical protein
MVDRNLILNEAMQLILEDNWSKKSPKILHKFRETREVWDK